jgi:hypothetical protein
LPSWFASSQLRTSEAAATRCFSERHCRAAAASRARVVKAAGMLFSAVYRQYLTVYEPG